MLMPCAVFSHVPPLCRFVGSAGQSFGCFLAQGMIIKLIGEGNDYVGKVSGNPGGLSVVYVDNTGFRCSTRGLPRAAQHCQLQYWLAKQARVD